MKVTPLYVCLTIVLILWPGAPPSLAAAATDDWDITPQHFWAGPWATAPRLPMVGDVDGDGRADLVSLWPRGEGVIDLVPTSPVGKPRESRPARGGFGRDGVAAVCGRFDALPGDDVLGVFADGSVRVAAGVPAGRYSFDRDTLAATLPKDRLPPPPLEAVAADYDGDGGTDVLLIGADGRALLLQNDRAALGPPRFRPRHLPAPFPAHRQCAAGTVGGDGRARLFWLRPDGTLCRTVLNLPRQGGASPSLSPPVTVLRGLPPEAKLAAGRFRGAGVADLIAGQTLLPGGDPAQARRLPSLPTVEAAKDDRTWLVGDFDGNGKDDLLRTRRSGARDYNEDAFLHFSHSPRTEPAKGYYASANDGLPDAWKLGLIRPGGLDLKALGCTVGRRDLLVEVQPLADVPADRLRAIVEGATRYLAGLPVKNPDGSTGVALHVIPREPIPTRERDYRSWADPSDFWREQWPKRLLPGRRGVTHYMGVQNGSGGYGGGDRAWCGTGWAEFLHEMGHQLWLSHSGRHSAEYCAAFPSLMNYAYSYGRNGRLEEIGYSTGALAAAGTLNEESLDETLPVPYEQAKFLAGPPYRFHVKPGNAPNTTLVDWNWNGVFGEKGVRADINYSHGATINPRFDIGHSWSAPALCAPTGPDGKERLVLFLGKFPAGTPVPSTAADAPVTSLCPELPGGLVVRVWQGKDRDRDGERWSPEVPVVTGGVAGDCSAAALGAAAWVAYPGAGNGPVTLRRVTVGADGMPQIGAAAVTIPGTEGATPTLAAWDGRLALLLWRGPERPVTLRLLTAEGDGLKAGPEQALGFVSKTPPAAVAGQTGPRGQALWVARMETGAKPKELPQTEVVRFIPRRPGGAEFVEQERQVVDGRYHAYRPTLLWEPDPGLSQGRLYLLSGGQKNPALPWAEQYLTAQTAYSGEAGGWRYQRYYTDDYASRCAPAACWFGGNMAYALRLYSPDPRRNDAVSLSFRGTGATPEPMGDLDEVSHVANFGLSRSIRTVE